METPDAPLKPPVESPPEGVVVPVETPEAVVEAVVPVETPEAVVEAVPNEVPPRNRKRRLVFNELA